MGVAPDGSLWVPSLLGMQGRDPDLGGGHQTVCGHGTDGVVRFDGETWSRPTRMLFIVRWLVSTLPAATAAGGVGFTIVPTGAWRLSGR